MIEVRKIHSSGTPTMRGVQIELRDRESGWRHVPESNLTFSPDEDERDVINRAVPRILERCGKADAEWKYMGARGAA